MSKVIFLILILNFITEYQSAIEYAKQYDSPWVALLLTGTDDNKCGGSLVKDRYIITAAHCVNGIEKNNYNSLKIRLGEWKTDEELDCGDDYDTCDSYVDIPPKDIKIHEKFEIGSNDFYYNDIAIIKLKREPAKSEVISNIELPSSEYLPNEQWIVAGFGKINADEFASTKKIMKMEESSKMRCEEVFHLAADVIKEYQICIESQFHHMTCKGDSGSGAVQKIQNIPVLHGIVSMGHQSCGEKAYPSILTKVYSFLGWINQTIAAMEKN